MLRRLLSTILLLLLAGCAMPPTMAYPEPTRGEPTASVTLTPVSASPTVTILPTITGQPPRPSGLSTDEQVLAKAIMPFADWALCNWQILGHNSKELYAWTFCQMVGGYESVASIPVVIKLDTEGHFQSVILPKDGTYYGESIRAMFPAVLHERVLHNQVDLGTLQAGIASRRADLSIPPVILTSDDQVLDPPLPTIAPTLTVTPVGALTPQPTPVVQNAPNFPVIQAREIQRWGEGTADTTIWSPDGKEIAIGMKSGISFRDAQTLKPIRFLNTDSAVNVLTYRPDSRQLAVGLMNGTLRVYDPKTGAVIREMPKAEGFPWDLAFNPDGRELLVTVESGSTGIILWNVETGQVINTLPVIPDTFRKVLFLPDGQALAYQHDGPKHDVWDVRTGAVIRRFSTTWAHGTAYSADGQLFATASQEGVLQVLRPAGDGFQPVARLDGQPDVWSTGFSPDGTLLAFGNNRGQVGIWDFRQGKVRFTLHTADDTPVGDHQVKIEAFSPDGRFLLSKGAGEILRIWDLSTGKTVQQADFTTYPKKAWFLQDGRLVGEVLGAEQSRLVNVQTNQILHQVPPGQNTPYMRMAVSPDGKYVTVSDDYDSLDVYPTGGTQPILHIAPLPGGVEDHVFHPDGQRLAVLFALGDTVAGPNPQALLEVWDLETGQKVFASKTPLAGNIVYSQDGKLLLVGSMDGRLAVYDAETGALRCTLDHGRRDFTWFPALASTEVDGRAVFLSGEMDGTIWEWDAQTGHTLAIFGQNVSRKPDSGISMAVTALALQPGGRFLVSGNPSGRLQFWDLQRGTLLGEQAAHNGSISSIAFRADGKQFVTSSEDQNSTIVGLRGGFPIMARNQLIVFLLFYRHCYTHSSGRIE